MCHQAWLHWIRWIGASSCPWVILSRLLIYCDKQWAVSLSFDFNLTHICHCQGTATAGFSPSNTKQKQEIQSQILRCPNQAMEKSPAYLGPPKPASPWQTGWGESNKELPKDIGFYSFRWSPGSWPQGSESSENWDRVCILEASCFLPGPAQRWSSLSLSLPVSLSQMRGLQNT